MSGKENTCYHDTYDTSASSGLEVIKKSCSTQLSMKFFPLINIKMPTIVGILTFMGRKNSILDLTKLEKCWSLLIILYFRAFEISCSAEMSTKNTNTL